MNSDPPNKTQSKDGFKWQHKKPKRHKKRADIASGLTWRKLTGKPSDKDIELFNVPLSALLQIQLEFTQVEWDAFGVENLTVNNFVKVGSLYFKPYDNGHCKPSEAALAAMQRVRNKPGYENIRWGDCG